MGSRGSWSWLVCTGALGLAIFAYIYGPAIEFYYLTKRAVKNDASLTLVPEPLSTSKIAQTSGETFAFFGTEFQVPWSGKAQVKQWEKLVRIQFPEGQFVMFFDPSTRVDRIKVLTESGRATEVERVFGSEAMRSNYAMVNTILNVAPKDLSLWMPRVQLVRNCTFLMLKKAEVLTTETGLYHFEFQNLRGFEKGNLDKSDTVILDVFDDHDREYEMFVGRTKATTGLVGQEDVNLILSTLKTAQAAPQADESNRKSSTTN